MSDKSERLLSCLSGISDESIDEAAEDRPRQKAHRNWKKWAALAAVLVLVVGAGSRLLPQMGDSTGSEEGGEGTGGTTTFMSYAGPVLPLSLKEGNSSITAVRNITLDFQPWVPVWISNEEAASRANLTGEEQQEILNSYNEWYPEGGRYRSSRDILVTDSYTLTNASSEEQTVALLYPFVSSLRELEEDRPAMTVDGQTLETVLHAGGYSGGFQGGAGQDGTPEAQLDLDQLNTWEEYRALLSDGSYLEQALGDYPDLTNIPVTVYEFTDPWGPEPDEDKGLPNPTIRADFNLNYGKTTVLSYGFNGCSQDVERGWMDQQFSIPQPGYGDYGQPRYLIVLGEDIENLTTQGYNTGGWDTTTTVEAGVTVRRYETDLDSILREVTALMFADRLTEEDAVDAGYCQDYEMYYGLFCEYLTSYGALAAKPAERYGTGWLWDTDFEAADRVFYLEAQVTIPAHGTVTLKAEMSKAASFDYYCGQTENRGVYGYDLMTELGSNLACTVQTATLEDRGQIEIIRQNFGFDLETGIRTVELDTETGHYYLEVKRSAQAD